MTLPKYVKKGFKIICWIIGSIIGLFLLLVLLIQVPVVQDVIKNKAVAYLEGKIHTPVSIGRIEIGLPKKLILEDVYLQSQIGDTLLAGQKIAVDISLFKLLDDEVEINSVSLNGIVANVKRDKDSVFNFDYIIDAFASKKPKKDSKPTIFSVHKISLKDIRVHFDDAITKNNLNASLVSFDTRMKTFDLEKMDFDVPKISLHGLTVKLKQGELVREIATKTIVTTDSIIKKRPDLKIKLGKIDFTKINIGYDNVGTRLNSGLILNKLFIDFEETNLQKQQIAINKFELEGVKAGLTLGKYDQKLNVNTLPAQKAPDWKLSVANTSVKRVDFRFDDENSLRVTKGIDYKHLAVQELQLEGKNLKYADEAFSGDIKSLSVIEQSGVNVEALRTSFIYNPRGVQLKNLYLKTPKTFVRDQVAINYPSLKALKTNPGLLGLNGNFKQSRIAFKDIMIFAPELDKVELFKNNPNAIANINGRVKGHLQDLILPQMEISGVGNLRINASGRIIGLPDARKAWYNLNIKNLQANAGDVRKLLGSEVIPNDIQLPEQMNLKGTFKGKLNNFNANLALNSSYGAAKIKTTFDYRIKNKEKYNGVAELNSFNLGKLIKNPSIGNITLKAKVKGAGLNPKTANATISGLMSQGTFKGYNYRNLALNGTIANGNYTAMAGMNDPNLDFDFVSEGNFKGTYPQVKAQLDLDFADLEKLKLQTKPLKAKGQLNVDFTTADIDYLNGKITAHHLLFSNDKEQFQLDSISVISTATAEKNTLELQSQIVKANFEGKYQLGQVSTAITNSIAHYYNLNPSAKKIATKPQRFDFTVTVNNDPVISQLMPQVKQLEPINISGRYNSVNDTIILNASVPRLVYGTNTISNASLKINTQDNALVYKASLDEIKNEQYRIPKTVIEGNLASNVLSYKLQMRDIKNKEQYVVAGTLTAANGNTELRLLPEDLLLNYEQWTISEDNLIRFGNQGIYATDFALSNADSSIMLQSGISSVPNAPLLLIFKDFKIETLSRMVQKESLALGGKVNGSIRLEDLTKQVVFTADMTIKDFTFKKEAVGDVSLKVNNQKANIYAIQMEITGNGNQVALDGFYQYNNQSFDMNLDMQQLNLSSIQPFTAEQLKKSSGHVSGKFKIKGTVERPRIIGDLQFHNGAITVTRLNSAFELLNDKITFNEQGMLFENFSLSDSEKNNLMLRGNVNTPNYRDFAFNLRINANNFKVTNSTAKDNDLYYGKLYVDSRLRVTGDLNKPIVDGRIRVNENTKFTVVLPQSDPAIAEREGIIEFIDQDAPPPDERFAVLEDSLSKSRFKGMNVSVAIEVDKDAELNLVIDKGNGDYLKLKGEAQLVGAIDESGKTSLTGRYELKEGFYEMTFNFLKRKFEIKNGSYILWTGGPTTADINITAVYKTLSAPIDLLGDQLGNVSPTVRNTYKQRIPFETLLKMKGELLKPEISFDITLPEGNYNVSSEIVTNTRTKLTQLRQQPDEMNKQVFALLLLNRFIGENPFASEAGTGTESLARQSVSKILSQQLNNLATDLIKGVEVDLDLETSDDYTTGVRENRTDLNVGISKQLLNDRLKVTVGSNFDIEGPEQANRDATNIAGNVSLNYQLSKDGRYALRAYRKNEYQVALQGQIIETGVAFTITMDYNKFSELFHRSEEEKEMKKKMQRRKKREREQKRELEKLQQEPAATEEKKT